MLKQIIDNKMLFANATFGLFKANKTSDETVTISLDQNTDTNLEFLRTQDDKRGKLNNCLADFIAPKSSG